MIAFAGNLHSTFVQSLLGKWENSNYEIKFGLTGNIGSEYLTIILNRKPFTNDSPPAKCMIEFSLRGEPSIVTDRKERFPILAMLPKEITSTDELRLAINNREERLQKSIWN